jgi:hypothetical protein
MTPSEFEQWQEECKDENIEAGLTPLSNDDFNIIMDMMAMQELSEYNPNDSETKETTISVLDGIALVNTPLGLKSYFTDLETIKYEQLIRKQKKKDFRKSKLTLIK